MYSLSIFKSILVILLTGLLFCACQDSVVVVETGNPLNSGEDDPGDDSGDDIEPGFFIVDRTGRSWNITHAVTKYGFDPDGFQFGLGVNAIPPILSPEMVCEGEAGYPLPSQKNMLVMGVNLNDSRRAYPMRVLARHEVVDEVFGDAHVAVAY